MRKTKRQNSKKKGRFTVQDLDYNMILQRITELGLKVDDWITYKEEICYILGVEYSSRTNTKAKHMKDISQFMKLESVGKGKGQKYKVVEIYDSVQERDDKRKENGKQATLGFEGEVLFHMIQCDLLRQNGQIDVHTNMMKQNDLSVALGLCSDLFKPLDDNKHLFTTHKINKLNDNYCHAQTHNVVFNNIYQRQRKQIEKMDIVGLERKTLIYENLKTEKDFTYKKHSIELVPTYYYDEFGNEIDCTYYDMKTTTYFSSIEQDDMSCHFATELEQAMIEDCRNECINNWNCHNKKKLRVFGEAFSKLNYSERQMFFGQLDDFLHESFDDNFAYSSSVYVYECSIMSEIEKLQTLGCDITVDNYDEFISHWSPFLQGEINKRVLTYRQQHLDKKLHEQQAEFDKVNEVPTVRSLGNVRPVHKFEYANRCLLYELEQAEVLVRLAFSVNLTISDYKFVEKLLKEDE